VDQALVSTIGKLLLPVAGSAVALAVSRARGLSWSEDLGLRRPRPGALALWLAIWVVWVAISEALIAPLGLAQAERWPPYSPLVVVLRVVAIGLAGPFLEELFARGLLLDRLRRTPLGVWGAVLVTAVAWAALHYRYGAPSVAMIAADGVLLGAARVRGGSLWIPIAMHALGNLFSCAQSLGIVG
jgi:membrane protease YdiL (CAAX protease family)